MCLFLALSLYASHQISLTSPQLAEIESTPLISNSAYWEAELCLAKQIGDGMFGFKSLLYSAYLLTWEPIQRGQPFPFIRAAGTYRAPQDLRVQPCYKVLQT